MMKNGRFWEPQSYSCQTASGKIRQALARAAQRLLQPPARSRAAGRERERERERYRLRMTHPPAPASTGALVAALPDRGFSSALRAIGLRGGDARGLRRAACPHEQRPACAAARACARGDVVSAPIGSEGARAMPRAAESSLGRGAGARAGAGTGSACAPRAATAFGVFGRVASEQIQPEQQARRPERQRGSARNPLRPRNAAPGGIRWRRSARVSDPPSSAR